MNRKIILIVFVIINVSSCASNQERDSNNLTQKIEEGVLDMIFQMDEVPLCTDEENTVMMAADSGNYEVVMAYLKNGGDPMLECKCEKKSNDNCSYPELSLYMLDCDSIRYVKYYLSLNITNKIKNDFFDYYLAIGNDEMSEYLISIGALMTNNYGCFPNSLPRISKAIELGYDINLQDPKNGWTVLMQFAFTSDPEEVDCKVEGIKYLISQGARLDIKNHDGQTALDLATDEKIKAYLMSFED